MYRRYIVIGSNMFTIHLDFRLSEILTRRTYKKSSLNDFERNRIYKRRYIQQVEA